GVWFFDRVTFRYDALSLLQYEVSDLCANAATGKASAIAANKKIFMRIPQASIQWTPLGAVRLRASSRGGPCRLMASSARPTWTVRLKLGTPARPAAARRAGRWWRCSTGESNRPELYHQRGWRCHTDRSAWRGDSQPSATTICRHR